MKVLEGTRKAVRRLIPVENGRIQHAHVASGEVLARLRKAPCPDVLPKGHIAQCTKDPLAVER